MAINKNIIIKNLKKIDYKKAWGLQEVLFEEIISVKKSNRLKSYEDKQITLNYLLICEHNHVYTLGRSFKGKIEESISSKALIEEEVPYFYINRGGDITYHGPGQIVIYPIINLEYFFKDIHKYLRILEEAVILTLKEFGIKSQRIEKLTGVWTKDPFDNIIKKVCAIGIRASYWTTMHGLALNVNTDLRYFDYIDPCGLKNKKAISINKIMQKPIEMDLVIKSLINNLKILFEFENIESIKYNTTL